MDDYSRVTPGIESASAAAARPAPALHAALHRLDTDSGGALAALAHQLRTPLTSALGYLELLCDGDLGPVNPDQEHALRTIAASIARLGDLVDELDPSLTPGAGRRRP